MMRWPSPVVPTLKLSEAEIMFLVDGVQLLLSVSENKQEEIAAALWRDILAKLQLSLNGKS